MKIQSRLLVAALIAFLAGCYPYPNEDDYVDDFDAVLTNYSDSFDFSANKDYYMPDSVTVLFGKDQDSSDYKEFFENGSDQLILETIRTNMQDAGYTFTDDTNAADVAINPVFSLLDYTGYVGSPGWWWGYPGYWDWYGGWWGGYYPGWGYPGWGYPGYGYSYTYTKGSVFIDMIDVTGGRAEDVEFVWTAITRGLVSTSVSYDQNRLVENIDQAFKQSPYLSE